MVEPVEPVFVVEPVDPVFVVEPVEPVFVAEPAEPVFVVEPADPVFVAEPAEPVFVVEPAEPVFVAEPAEPVLVVEPVEPVFVAEPAEPVLVVEPVEPVFVAEPAEPVFVVEPELDPVPGVDPVPVLCPLPALVSGAGLGLRPNRRSHCHQFEAVLDTRCVMVRPEVFAWELAERVAEPDFASSATVVLAALIALAATSSESARTSADATIDVLSTDTARAAETTFRESVGLRHDVACIFLPTESTPVEVGREPDVLGHRSSHRELPQHTASVRDLRAPAD